MKKNVLYCMLLGCFANLMLQAQIPPRPEYRPDDIWLRGEINKTKLEMILEKTEETDEERLFRGEYYYLNTLKPFALEGTYSKLTKQLRLEHRDKGKLKETFVFENFDWKGGIGEWTKNEQKQPCKLQEIPALHTGLFFEKFKEEYKEFVTSASADKIIGFSPDEPQENFGCEEFTIETYSKSGLVRSYCEKEEGIRVYSFQLMPDEKLPTILQYTFSSNRAYEEDETTCDYTLYVVVHQYQNKAWKTLFSKPILSETTQNPNCNDYVSVSVAANRIGLQTLSDKNPDNSKMLRWKWNGKTFEPIK